MNLSHRNIVCKKIKNFRLGSNAFFFLMIFIFLIYSCGTPQKTIASSTTSSKEEPVRIANDSLAYEIFILDVGFNSYIATAKPMSYYSKEYLAARNIVYVTEWNNRARNPSRYNSNIYENIIDYQPQIDYGLEVNYKLFNYFQFAQRKYKMRLGNFRS